MSLDDAIRETVTAALREALPAIRTELGRPRLLPIRETPVAYRAILAAEQRGELTVYRVGHASLVDEAELYEWVRRTGAPRDPKRAAPADEVGELIAINETRRARRKGAA